ncbi:LptF/LptG family permease [Halobacteriovorax sp. XZX-3]|uniref:LptF/LptG family permease n=1 Tax=unclassified Halobacteriovorax TaxID=2639665 RepID=UPI003710E44C
MDAVKKIKDLIPTKIFQRYLASNFIVPFAMSLTFFVAFLLTTQLFKFMRLVTKKGVGIFQFLEILGHISISFIPMATPLSILFAMIYTLNKLSEDSEIVALRAMGINKHRIFSPYFIISILIAVSVVSLNTNMIPTSKKIFRNTFKQLGSKGILTDIKKEQFFTEIPGVILFAEDVKDDGKILENVFLRISSKDGVDKVIMAKLGVLNKPKSDGDSSGLNIRFDFFNGSIISIDKEGHEVEKILFETYEYPIVTGQSFSSVNKASMMSSNELRRHIRKLKGQLKNTKTKKIKDKLEDDIRKGNIEYWERFTIPIQCIVFALLGFVFGVKKGRGATRNTSALALLVTIVYYTLYFSGVSVAKKSNLPIPLVLFLPAVVTGAIGISYYKKLDWNS